MTSLEIHLKCCRLERPERGREVWRSPVPNPPNQRKTGIQPKPETAGARARFASICVRGWLVLT